MSLEALGPRVQICKEKKIGDATRGIKIVESVARHWAVSSIDWNHYIHALVGNTGLENTKLELAEVRKQLAKANRRVAKLEAE